MELALTPIKVVKMSYLKAANVKPEDPLIDQCYAFIATMPASKLPEWSVWVAYGRKTPRYLAFAPKYTFTGTYTADLVEDYGTKAACMNRTLEGCFGARGVPNWSIWVRGDHMNSLFQDVRLAYNKLKAEGEKMSIIDIWVQDLHDELKKIYYGDDMPAESTLGVPTSRSGRLLLPSVKSPLKVDSDGTVDLCSPSPVKISAGSAKKRKSLKITQPLGSDKNSKNVAPLHGARKSASVQQSKLKLDRPKDKVKRKRKAIVIDSETEVSDSDGTPSPPSRKSAKTKASSASSSQSLDSPDSTGFGVIKTIPEVFLYFIGGQEVPDHPRHPAMKLYKCKHCPKSQLADSSSNLSKHRLVCQGRDTATRDGAPGALPNLRNPSQSQLVANTGSLLISFLQGNFNEKVAEWVAVDGRPFYIVHSELLEAIIKYLQPNACLPSVSTVTRRIHAMYERGLEALVDRLKTVVGTIHYAFDAWTTASRGAALLGVMGFYYDSDFKYQQVLLGFMTLKGRHTGERIGAKLYHQFKRLGIEKQIGPGTGDNASNNLTAAQIVSDRLEDDHDITISSDDFTGCVPHITNLAAHVYIGVETTLSPIDYSSPADPDLPFFTLIDYDGDHEKVLGERNEVSHFVDDEPVDDVDSSADDDDMESDADDYDPELDKTLASTSNPIKTKGAAGAKERRKLHDQSPLGMVHNIGRYVRHSPQRIESFRICNDEVGCDAPDLLPLTDVIVRWDSKYTAAKRALLLEKSILLFTKRHAKDGKCPRFTKDTFSALRETIPVLEIFFRLTKKYSANEALAHDYISDLHQAIEDLKRAGSTLSPIRKAGCSAAAEKFEKYVRRAIKNDWLCTAFALDHNVRQAGLEALLAAYGESARLPTILSFINKRIQAHADTLPFDQPAGSQDGNTDDSLNSSSAPLVTKAFAKQPQLPTHSTAASELWASFSDEDYMFAAATTEKRIESVHSYWRRLHLVQSHIRPICLFAKDVLSLPASSASVERLFSDAGNVVGRKRGSLLAKTLAAQTSVKVWHRQGIDMSKATESGE